MLLSMQTYNLSVLSGEPMGSKESPKIITLTETSEFPPKPKIVHCLLSIDPPLDIKNARLHG